MGLPYPGGPQLARLAEQGTPGAYRFARPMTDRPGLDFSFSGLKTQVLMAWRDSDQSEQTRADIARGFEDAVVETLSIKCERALEAAGTNVIVVAGGVGANKRLRARLQQMAERLGGRACFPRPALCTDNGAMIAFAGALRLQAGQHSPPKVDVTRAGTWRRCRRYEPVAPGLARRTHYARPAHGDAANTVVARSWCCSQPRVCGQRAWISCGNAIFKPLVQMAPSKAPGEKLRATPPRQAATICIVCFGTRGWIPAPAGDVERYKGPRQQGPLSFRPPHAGRPPPVPGRLTAVPLPWPPVFVPVRAMDKVFIEGLTIDALIGIYDWERRIRQDLVFDLEMGFDNRRPAATDDIAHTLNYKAVSKRLEQFVRESEFGLVETLAERCAQIVLDEFEVKWLRLKLSKPGAVRGARAVGVIIERTRD